jgi:hypothetical protein
MPILHQRYLHVSSVELNIPLQDAQTTVVCASMVTRRRSATPPKSTVRITGQQRRSLKILLGIESDLRRHRWVAQTVGVEPRMATVHRSLSYRRANTPPYQANPNISLDQLAFLGPRQMISGQILRPNHAIGRIRRSHPVGRVHVILRDEHISTNYCWLCSTQRNSSSILVSSESARSQDSMTSRTSLLKQLF